MENSIYVFKHTKKEVSEYKIFLADGTYIIFSENGSEISLFITKRDISTNEEYIKRQTEHGFLFNDFYEIEKVFLKIQSEITKQLEKVKTELPNMKFPVVEKKEFVSVLKKKEVKDLFSEL